MPVTPERSYELLEEACKEAAEQFDEWLDQIWDEGIGVWRKQKPRDRLAFYQQNTLSADVFLVTDPDYMKLRDAGQAPPLFAEIMAQQYEQAVMLDQQASMLAEQNGLPPPIDAGVLPEPPPMLWVLLLKVPRIFEKAGRDFGSLTRAKLRDMEEVPV